ncbi:MAG TPA: uracil phosphoribosyltransferase [Chloroflexota bacterium]|nr:uracil phosphoribosyltransferase [Chloroflexota bacterium]
MAHGSDLPMRGVSQPSAEAVLSSRQLRVSRHPVVLHTLSRLRSIDTGAAEFSGLVAELSRLLAYEALADLTVQPVKVQTPMESTGGFHLAERVGLVPILRAGLGMVASFRELIPNAEVWHLGLYRDEHSLEPVEYYNRLPSQTNVQTCFVLDPMLATGGSACGATRILQNWGVRRIKYVGLIAAPYGVQQLTDQFPDVDIHVAALDRELDERGYILPGLGDAGDRQFGTGSSPAGS